MTDIEKQGHAESADSLKGRKGLRRMANAFHYSRAGLRTAFSEEAAFRELCLLCGGLVSVAFLLDVSRLERGILVIPPVLCLIVELLNTAIENTVDRVSLDIHPLAKNAKDLGSAAQLVSLILCALVWLIVLS